MNTDPEKNTLYHEATALGFQYDRARQDYTKDDPRGSAYGYFVVREDAGGRIIVKHVTTKYKCTYEMTFNSLDYFTHWAIDCTFIDSRT